MKITRPGTNVDVGQFSMLVNRRLKKAMRRAGLARLQERKSAEPARRQVEMANEAFAAFLRMPSAGRLSTLRWLPSTKRGSESRRRCTPNDAPNP